MRYLSVCSGIEAATAAWHPLGWEPVAFSEIEKFPSAVLSHHYPSVPNWGDMTKFQEWPDACRCVDAGDSWPGRQLRPGSSERRVGECASDSERRQGGNRERGRGDSAASTFCGVCGGANIDLLVGGTPCQSFSVAGLRKGLADPRGNLALTFLAIADKYRPEWVVWENVPGVLSSNQGRDFGAFLGGLGQLGYGWAYRVLDAQYFGLAQRRKRVFVVANLGSWQRAAAVLFERASLSGHPAPRREAGEGVADGVANCLRGRSSASHRADSDNYIGGIDSEHNAHGVDVSGAVSAKWAKGTGGPAGDECYNLTVAHALRGEGVDASEDGTGRGTPLVAAFAHQAGGKQTTLGYSADGLVQTLGANQTPAVAFTAKDYGADAGDIAPTLRAGGHTGSHANGGVMPAVAFAQNQRDEVRMMQLAAEPGAKQQTYALHQMAVRRLTPRECERLMGYPDDYTLVPWRGKLAPDGPRYKALGNSMAVPVVRWIGQRIQAVSDALKIIEKAC